MHKSSPKYVILAALHVKADVSSLGRLPSCDSSEGRALLRWMDRSGLALYFWWQLKTCRTTDAIPRCWRNALDQRHADNMARTSDMLREFRRVTMGFARHGIKAVALKGFSLVPDFCEDAPLRHQADFDFLVAPKDVKGVAMVLQAHGYAADHVSDSGETCFTTPLQRIPSTEDYLYARQHQRQVDLHVSLWEPSPWLEIETPKDSMDRAERRTLDCIEFWTLDLADSYLNQVLHVFRHSMKSWIRLSWLLELARCMELHRADTALWNSVVERAGEATITRKAFALVLGLVDWVFDVQAPSALDRWLEGVERARLEAWLRFFGVDWAVAEWPGSLSNLFVTEEFIPESKLRAQYWRSRLLPRRATASIGAIAVADAKTFAKVQVTRAYYLAQRAVAHMKDICALPVQSLRWRRAMETARRNAVAMNS
jgi:Uncharacterised nucleotidyltransferase